MQLIEIPLDKLEEAPWNPNQENEVMINHLKENISRYGLVAPLVIRPKEDSHFEVISGNHRLKILKSLKFSSAPCVVVKLSDHEARLLAQALNNIHGEDDLALKGSLLKQIISVIPEGKVLSILPESIESLKALSSIGEKDLAQHLQAWQKAQAARLKHMQLQFTGKQLETVEEALRQIMPRSKMPRLVILMPGPMLCSYFVNFILRGDQHHERYQLSDLR